MEIDGKQVPGDQKDITKKIRFEKIRRLPGSVCKMIWKIGRDDPRRVIHALKVGLSLTLVSMLYLLEPLFAGIGKNAIWAVMTVVVVLEFTVGATLSKGLNRGLGTLIAGSLAFFIQYIADESGRIFRAIFIGTAVFIIGFASTYFRFIPYIKKNYDYGVVVFLLTFNLVTVSSYRVENVMKVAHDRLYNIAIGVGICLVMSLCFFPIWSGEDLHCSTANKLEGLGRSIEACVEKYFEDSEIVEDEDSSDEDSSDEDSSDEDPIYKEYKAVLDSKNVEEILALQASWEPRSMRRCYQYPWQQYVKLGAAVRQFVYTAVALHGCSRSEILAPASVRVLFKDPCLRVAREVAKAFRELGDSIRNRRCCSPEILSDNLEEALQDLNNSIESQPRYFLSSNKNCRAPYTPDHPKGSERKVLNRTLSRKESQRRILKATLTRIASISLEFSEALTFAAFAALLVEMVAKLEMVIEQVEKLGKMAKFKEFKIEDIQIIVDDRHKKGSIKSMQTELPPSNDAF